jgi:hypothetical protein
MLDSTATTPATTTETSPDHPGNDPLQHLRTNIEQRLQQFRHAPVTPKAAFDLEQDLKQLLDLAGAAILQQEFNRLEPDDKQALPPKVRYHRQTYRRNKKTPATIATVFGPLVLRSFLYLCTEDGEPGLHPLHLRLGIGAGAATAALLQRLARWSVDHTQAEVRQLLRAEHGLRWSNDRLRTALRGFRQALVRFQPEAQQARVLLWLGQAERARGQHRPVLAVGRDGVMVPMRDGTYQEASTATVSVYDRRRRRLGTVYLGQMPEAKQKALSQALTALVTAILRDWSGPQPRLVYVTDKGSAQDDYYRHTLRRMKDPRRPTQVLAWEWVLDFFHVCGYVGKVAEALFGRESKAGAAWFARMRRWLRDRRGGVAHIVRSAMQHRMRRKMSKAAQAEFWKAYRYLRKHQRWMDYVGARRRGLPIGSGVTEAACKTVFAQRFKRSGMRWGREFGQVILDLRVLHLSGIWDEVFRKDLQSRTLPEPLDLVWGKRKTGSSRPKARAFWRFAG